MTAEPRLLREADARGLHQYGNYDEWLDPHAVPVLPESYEYLGGGHQSVWLLNAMLQRTASHSEPWVTPVLTDVSADHLGIFRNASRDELVAVWRGQERGPPGQGEAAPGPQGLFPTR